MKSKEWWISGWDKEGYFPKPESVITIFLTSVDPKKPEAFRVVDADAYDNICGLAHNLIMRLKEERIGPKRLYPAIYELEKALKS